MKIGEIIVNVPTRAVNQTFSYSIPIELDFLDQGWRVIISFGNREVEGFIFSIHDGDATGLKPVKAALDDFPWFDESMISLAKWLSDYYLCSLSEALRLFVPGKQGIKTDHYYQLSCRADTCLFAEDLVAFIAEKQPVRKEVLLRQFGSDALTKIQHLIKSGIVVTTTQAKTREQQRFSVEYSLTNPATISLESYARKPLQRRMLESLMTNQHLTKTAIKQLNIPSTSVQKLVEAGIITARKIPLLCCDSYAQPTLSAERKVLTEEQEGCLTQIKTAIETQTFQPFLLHGITGSGKTEVYLAAAAAARAQGRQVIVLVPEIALTSQIVDRFKRHFTNDIVVFHSKLSLRERYDAWRRLREKQAGIAIGARSAIFAPLSNLGLIILDEEHEFTFKQEESPRYHARTVALQRAKLSGAAVVFGSATPAIETYQAALAGQYQLLELTTRVDNALLPNVAVVDMRDEMARGKRSVISERLACLLQETISRGEQAIVLLNRRGYSTFLLCRECGHVMRCRHCAVSLVYHAASQSLRCHYCRSHEAVPDVCPACQSRYIRYFGSGTQKAEEELRRLLPAARLLRMDQDTTGGRFAAERILREFHAGEHDILLGTQMVAKGHDIANVTAVGILAADTTLNLPDFRAAEKTFALITQAAGRAGRGKKSGSVIVQTYNPEHYAVQSGVAQDYKQFYASEAEYRRTLNYPPFVNLIRFTVTSDNEDKARRDADKLASVLRNSINNQGVEILGPFPSTILKLKDNFRMNILLKHTTDIKQKLANLPELVKSGVAVDVDPYNML